MQKNPDLEPEFPVSYFLMYHFFKTWQEWKQNKSHISTKFRDLVQS